MSSNATIFGATFMMTNICLGTTIFTFAIRAKSFGLVWILVACVVTGIINYWSITNCCIASSRVKCDDYSEITQLILGKKGRTILNVIIIVYTYGCMMCLFALIFPLFGRFIYSVGYTNKYNGYEDFQDKIWYKAYVRFPFYIGIAFLISLMCLIKDINKLNFSAYIGVVSVIYAIFVVMVECKGYYDYYKETIYVEEDKSTHPNWVNLGDAFTKKLDFFKGMASLFAAYACHTGVFPIYSGFKHQENGLKKMKIATINATILTTILHYISIICSFLTNPYAPEDVIIYRKSKSGGKDIPMTIAKLLISSSLVFTLPGYFFGLRLSVANSFTGGKISNKFNYLFTFISCFGCALVAAVYDKILNYVSYIGGFISVFICYLFPCLLYIYSSGKPITYWKNFIELFIAIVLCIVGYIAGVATIIDDVSGS
jgi:amino acid permease